MGNSFCTWRNFILGVGGISSFTACLPSLLTLWSALVKWNPALLEHSQVFHKQWAEGRVSCCWGALVCFHTFRVSCLCPCVSMYEAVSFHLDFLHICEWTLFLNKVVYICRALKILAVKIVIMKWNNRDLWKWNSCHRCAVWAVTTQLFFCGSVFVKDSSSNAKSFCSPFSPAPCSLYWAGIDRVVTWRKLVFLRRRWRDRDN